MENQIGTIENSYYVHPSGLAFDFRNKSAITFILFMGAAVSIKPLKTYLDFYNKLFYRKLKKLVNVVIVADRQPNTLMYTGNYRGISGLCDSVWQLGKLLNHIIYEKHHTERTKVFGDCGGSLPAILTSTVVPYHSITFTTPYYEVLGNKNEFDVEQYSMWFARNHSVYTFDNLSEHKPYFDTIEYYDEYTKTTENQLNLHWASNIKGTDLLFRHKANMLPKRSNLRIIDHLVPSDVEGHMLIKWLSNTGLYYSMILDEIKIQQAIIDTKRLPNVTQSCVNINDSVPR